MRKLWLVFLSISLFAQSLPQPGKSIPVDNAVPATKSTKDSAPKKAEPRPAPSAIAPPAQASSDKSQQAAQSGPAKKPPEVTPDPIVRYTFWLVIVGILQFAALIIQAIFLYLAFRETTAATGLTARALAEAQRSNSANEALTRESNTNARISANAAKASADALKNSERAWVIVDADPNTQPSPETCSFHFWIWNTGKTPAIVTFTKSELTVLAPNAKLPETPTYSITNPGSNENMILAMGRPDPQTIGNFGFYTQNMNPGEIYDIQTGQRVLYVFGEVGYKDAFGDDRKTIFGFRWASGVGWDRGVPEAYNDCT